MLNVKLADGVSVVLEGAVLIFDLVKEHASLQRVALFNGMLS